MSVVPAFMHKYVCGITVSLPGFLVHGGFRSLSCIRVDLNESVNDRAIEQTAMVRTNDRIEVLLDRRQF